MKRLYTFTILLLFFLVLISPSISLAQEDSKKQDLQKQIQEYEQKLTELRNQKNTLASQIEYMDTLIYLAGLRITESEKKVEIAERDMNVLGEYIAKLDDSMDSLSEALLQRISESYKNRKITIFDVILGSENVSDLTNQYKYQLIAKERNQKVLLQVQETKINYEEQKKLREKKVQELEKLKESLSQQKIDLSTQQDAKRELLVQTQNDEVTYQNLLTKLRSEYAAIQGIVSGSGTETELGDVTKGETIASVIPGASCNSSGGHLHFIVQENGSVTDPFKFLKSVDSNNCSGSSCGSGDGDSFNPTGNWDWPLSPQIKMNQGYGTTWAVRNTWVGNIYNFHNGIDITGSSYNVSAVADGTLYRGSYSGSGGCALPYMKLEHKDSNITTLYLHVYSQ